MARLVPSRKLLNYMKYTYLLIQSVLPLHEVVCQSFVRRRARLYEVTKNLIGGDFLRAQWTGYRVLILKIVPAKSK